MRRTTNTTIQGKNGQEYTEGLYREYKKKTIEELLKIRNSLNQSINRGILDRDNIQEFQYKIDLIDEMIEERERRKLYKE